MRMLEWICVLIKNTSHHLHFIFLSIVSAVHSCGWMYKTTHCSQIYKRCWHTRFFFIDLWDACCSFSGSIFYFGLLLEYFLYALTPKTHQFSRTVQLCCVSTFQLTSLLSLNIGINYAYVWHGDVVWWKNWIKGRTTGEAFQEQCFPWERGDPVGADFGFCNFQDLSCTEESYITHWKKERKKKRVQVHMFKIHSDS